MVTKPISAVSSHFDEQCNCLQVEVPLPGAMREQIDLRVYTDGLRVEATDQDDVRHVGAFGLCCPVDRDAVTATFDDGLLKVTLPMDKAAAEGTSVSID